MTKRLPTVICALFMTGFVCELHADTIYDATQLLNGRPLLITNNVLVYEVECLWGAKAYHRGITQVSYCRWDPNSRQMFYGSSVPAAQPQQRPLLLINWFSREARLRYFMKNVVTNVPRAYILDRWGRETTVYAPRISFDMPRIPGSAWFNMGWRPPSDVTSFRIAPLVESRKSIRPVLEIPFSKINRIEIYGRGCVVRVFTTDGVYLGQLKATPSPCAPSYDLVEMFWGLMPDFDPDNASVPGVFVDDWSRTENRRRFGVFECPLNDIEKIVFVSPKPPETSSPATTNAAHATRRR